MEVVVTELALNDIGAEFPDVRGVLNLISSTAILN